MLTVRFPNGQAVQYNTANHASRGANYTDIYTRQGGAWVAQVPNTAIIESTPACRVYNPLPSSAIDIVLEMLREKVTDRRLSVMKRLLAKYNTKTGLWK
jgi:hypothetical protein